MAGAASPRPLRGKSFYLDLPSGRDARELAEAIGRLGGVTESFLSKEVSYVVSSNREAKGDKGSARTEKRSDLPSEEAKAPSPMPSTSKGSRSRPPQKLPDTALLSRGKELLQKARKNQDPCGGSSILANARLWGVQILHVDEMLSYTQQLLRAVSGARKRCQKTEAKCPAPGSRVRKGKLKAPFLKVEDQSRQFRPFHHQFKNFPDLNFLAPKSSSPFEPPKSLSNPCRARGAEGCGLRSEGEQSPRSMAVAAPKKRRGFCECCQETFEELQKHLQSPQHKRFALDDLQYVPVDWVISQLTNSFVELSAVVPRSGRADEDAAAQARVAGGVEMLPAELGKKRQQPEQDVLLDTECDHSLKTTGCSPCPPRDRVSSPGGAAGLSRRCFQGLPAGAAACAGTTQESALGAVGLGSAPDLHSRTCVVARRVGEVVVSAEPRDQQVLGAVGHRPEAPPASGKRRLSAPSSPARKKPRLELGAGLPPGEPTEPVGGGVGGQGAGQRSSTVEAGSSPQSTELCSRSRSSLGRELSPCGEPTDPPPRPGSREAMPMGFGPTEAAASERGWSRARASSPGKQLRGENDNVPGAVRGPGLESLASGSICPAGPAPSPELPGAGARCCCSLSVRAAEKIAPELPTLPGHSEEQAPCPRRLQPPPPPARAGHGFGGSSSQSGWGVQLLSVLTGVQDSRTQPGDRDGLQRTTGSVGNGGYRSQLGCVLKQKLELACTSQEDKSCWNCCAETRGASLPVLEPTFGCWTS